MPSWNSRGAKHFWSFPWNDGRLEVCKDEIGSFQPFDWNVGVLEGWKIGELGNAFRIPL